MLADDLGRGLVTGVAFPHVLVARMQRQGCPALVTVAAALPAARHRPLQLALPLPIAPSARVARAVRAGHALADAQVDAYRRDRRWQRLPFDLVHQRRFPLAVALGQPDRLQRRVSAARLETQSPGFILQRVRVGVDLWQGASWYAGATNLGDKFYSEHLNSRNPFTRERVPEMGRALTTGLTMSW